MMISGIWLLVAVRRSPLVLPGAMALQQPSCGQSRALTLTMSFVARYDVTPGAVSSSGRSKAAHTRALYLTEIS